jgi:hypothetical protein
MKLSSRALLGLVFSAMAFTACDYQRYSPGINTQFEHGFVNPPGWRNEDVNRDSINYRQKAYKAIGKGSAADLRTASVQDQVNSAPAGKSAASPQAANGTVEGTDKAQSDTRNGGNGNGAATQSTTTNTGGNKGAGQ